MPPLSCLRFHAGLATDVMIDVDRQRGSTANSIHHRIHRIQLEADYSSALIPPLSYRSLKPIQLRAYYERITCSRGSQTTVFGVSC